MLSEAASCVYGSEVGKLREPLNRWARGRRNSKIWGMSLAAYDALITSGDVTRDYIAARPGCALFDVGPGVHD